MPRVNRCRGFMPPVRWPVSAAAVCMVTTRWRAHSLAAACFQAALRDAGFWV